MRAWGLLAVLGVAGVGTAAAQENAISLAGTWRFQLDGGNVGVEQQWFARPLEDTVRLPGTTDENQKGTKKDEQCVDRLSRVYYWKGPAWYQRDVTIPDANISWAVKDSQGQSVAAGSLAPVTIAQGKVSDAGTLGFPLAEVKAPRKLCIEVAIRGTPFVNRYDLWVYPPKVDASPPAGVQVVRTLDPATVKRLQGGGRVLLLPVLADFKHSIKGSFQTDFWCFPMFRRAAERNRIEVAPGALGILCDPKCPALAEFPTEFHGNWQWWHLSIRIHGRPLMVWCLPPTLDSGPEIAGTRNKSPRYVVE